MKTEENRDRSDEQSNPLTDTDKLLARLFDVLLDMDFEQQHRQAEESSNAGD
ncbi:MAG: hypothetical protein NC218_12640 [Acetobacter sp.]|nr:hypothetical protein [Acetobacter sp.]